MADAYDNAVRQAVIDALDAGDDSLAVEILLVAYGQLVYGHCRRMLGSAGEAEDAMQLVFTQTLERAQDLREVECLRAWLRGVARYRCLDRIENRERDRSRNSDEDVESAPSCPVALTLRDPLLRHAIEQCIDALDDRSRIAIFLKFSEQLSYKQMSEIMNDSPGALRTRVARSLPTLRDCLQGKGVET